MLWVARIPLPEDISQELLEDQLLDLDGVTFSWEEVDGRRFLVLYASAPVDLELGGLPELRWEKLPPGWETRYREYFRGFPWGDRLYIHPPWEEGCAGKVNVVINPGRGFGTGTHNTTRICLGFLEEMVGKTRFSRLLDVGTGSGILAIAGVKLGIPRAVAIDIDLEALENARENLILNGVADRVDLVATGPQGVKGSFPLVVANLHYYAFLSLSKELARLTAPGGYLVISGFLIHDTETMAHEMALVGFKKLEERHLTGWGGLLLVRG